MTTAAFLALLREKDIRVWLEDGQIRYSAPNGVITATLLEQLRERKADILACIDASQATTSEELPPISRAPRNDGFLPLSFGQEHLWLIEQLQPGNSAYNMAGALRLTGSFDMAVFQKSFHEILRRHEVLRAAIVMVDGKAMISVGSIQTLPPSFIDLSEVSSLEQPMRVQQLAREIVQKPFDLTRGSALRAAVLRLGVDDHILIMTGHHIVVDGWSGALLIHELHVLYSAFLRGQPSPLPDPSLQYADFAAWQRSVLQDKVLEEQLAYWTRQLGGMSELQLPTDRPRPPIQRFCGALHSFEFSAQSLERLNAVSREYGATLFMTLVAIFQIVLHRYSRQTDIGIGASFAGRNRPDIEEVPGHFANVVVLRSDLAGNPSFGDFLAHVRKVVLDAYAHQDVPFGLVVERVNPERDASRNPLFQVAIVLHNRPMQAPAFGDLDCKMMEIDRGTSQFDLLLSLTETAQGLNCGFEYNTDLFDTATMERMGEHLRTLAEAIATNPKQRIGDFPLLTDVEREQVLTDWNATERAYPVACLHELIEAQVQRTPQAIALTFENRSLTYAELNTQANRLAHYLGRLGVGPDVLVGVCAERSIEMVVGLLAILKAGGAYVPLDPSYPQERLAYMLSDVVQPNSTVPLVLLTQSHLAPQLPKITVTLLCLDTDAERWRDESVDNPSGKTLPEHLAYMIYTSGSTGQPKGALNTHRGIVNRLLWMQEAYSLTETDRVLQKTPFSFDVSVWEFFWPLLAGARLVVARPEGHKDSRYLSELIHSEGVTTLHFVPSMLNVFLETVDPARCASVKRVFCSGEVLPYETQERFFERLNAELHNLYGPTEAAVDVTYWVCQRDSARRVVPIGRPIANTQIYLLDTYGNPVPVGVPGELNIGGAGVFLGYHNKPELTAQALVPNPFATVPNAHSWLYKTGDLARWLPDGTLDYLGRIDHQVKIRGFRIELGEIEAVLGQHDGVHETVVVARPDGAGSNELVAYVVPTESTVEENMLMVQYRAHLKEKLPEYMVPSAFVLLQAMPLSPNGKVDRKALPAPKRAGAGVYVPAGTIAEEQLTAIWMQALGAERIGVYDNFFHMGGHSLSAMRVMARVQEVFQVEVPLRTLFEAPTVAKLAEHIESMRGECSVVPFPSIIHDAAKRYEPFPLTDVQRAYWLGRGGLFEFGNAAAHLYQELECSDLDLDRFTFALRRLIERHDALRLIVRNDGQQQILRDVPTYQIPTLDLRGDDASAVDAALQQRRDEMSHHVFDAHHWPLFDVRASLMRDGHTRLHIGLDLLIFDGSSLLILARELGQLYADPAAELPPLEISFRDYVLAEKSLEETERYHRSLTYWRGRATDFPSAPDLPLALQPAELTHPRFVRNTGGLSAAEWGRIKHWATRRGLTPTHAMLTAFSELLAAWSKTPRLTINLTLYHRFPLHRQVDDLVGDFTALELLAVDGSTGDSFEQRAKRIQQQLWNDLDHRYVTGVQVLQELARQQGGTGKILMPIVFTSLLNHTEAVDAIPLPWKGEIGFGVSQTPQMWMDHQVIEVQGGLVFNWDVLEGLFPDGLVQDMFDSYQCLLRHLAQDESAWTETERCLIPAVQLAQRRSCNATESPLSDALLHTLVEAQAAQRSGDAAIITPSLTLTYAELMSRARRVGRWLREQGAQPNQLIAVVMEKGWEQIVAVLGILQSGAAYLPIDPALPQERQYHLLEQGQVTIALTQASLSSRLSWPVGVTVAAVDQDAPWQAVSDAPLSAVQQPTDLAYVIYTSGSTGMPKGVMIDHRGAVNTILDINERFGVGPQDRVLAMSALNFDLSVYDIFGVLAAGGTVVVPAADAVRDPSLWATQIAETSVTIWNTVPALFELLVGHIENNPSDALKSLRIAMLSGDWIPVTLPQRVWSLAPNVKMHSLGGATEASIWSIGYPIEQVDPAWTSIPYGKPLRNQTFHVLNRNLNPCPVWVSGELYIGGTGLAKGYWRDDEKTRNSFILHPRTRERLYKTGDMGRYLPDGNIEFQGREDGQVKISGYRIELGEIESALNQHPALKAGVVSVIGERQNRRLVAHLVLADNPAGQSKPATNDLSIPVLGLTPAEIIESKLRRDGLRASADLPVHSLPQPVIDERLQQVSEKRRSQRAFLAGALGIEQLSALLGCLRSRETDGFPHYDYGSAGSLYAVQTYLVVKPNRVAGLPGGSYYYDPSHHRLLALKSGAELDADLHYPANQLVADEAAFSIFFIGKMRMVESMYGELSRDFCLIETGAMAQLLELSAPAHGLGLCQLGGVRDSERLKELFLLDQDHRLLQVIVGGAPDSGRQSLAATLKNLTHSLSGDTTEEVLIDTVRTFLQTKLPPYMVPQQYVIAEALPLSPNGKVDRKALAEQVARMVPTTTQGVAPSTKMEQVIAQALQEELVKEDIHIEAIHIDDNFFDLGFSSAMVIRLYGTLKQHTGKEFSVIKLFEHPNIRALAAWLADGSEDMAAIDQEYDRAQKKQEALARRSRNSRSVRG